jgi:hypothetical protein
VVPDSMAPLLETAIGLVLMWFVAATLCSGITEMVSTALGFRASALWHTLGQALGTPEKSPNVALVSAAKMARKVTPDGGSVLDRFVDNVPGVVREQTKRVKSIPTEVASMAIVATRNAHPSDFSKTQLGTLVENLPAEIKDDANALRDWVGHWFDGTMSSLSAKFRRNIRWWTVPVSVVIVVGFGAESIGFAQRLYHQPTQQVATEAAARRIVAGGTAASECKKTKLADQAACVKATANQLTGLEVSFWLVPDHDRLDWWWAILGFAVTVAAIAAGAPFWFDVLRRLTGLRKPTAGTAPSTG